MPLYPIECHDCGVKSEKRLTFSEFDAVRAGTQEVPCSGCGSKTELGFAPGSFGFILKEGPSGGWASKSIKENKYRKRHGKVMEQRQKDHVRTPKLQPNYKGEETGSWRDAREAVRKDKGDIAASTYDPLVKKEKAKK